MVNKISIQKLKNGSQAEFKQLVEHYKNKVVNTCYGFVHNYTDAQDISQDVFIEVFESVGRFNEDSLLSTWIYRIAVNKSLDFLRKQKRKKRWSELTRINIDDRNEADNWFTDTGSPQLSLEQKERVKILSTAIDSLPESQKSAFTLHKYEELSYKEISEILKTSVSSVESLMHRAKKNLQKKLTKYYLTEKEGNNASF
ncbi:MAG: RNA polymerase sigma factor [Salinivirgaceae bacterium]|jgi:RNA polymerase sigma-70 factor (ECF subfamily)|nr:RNA polymerase sigma factor [Salinivirgaceae bacterium]